jgi:hypothetical protein
MLKTAGFKVIEEEDLVLTAEIPWYEPLSPNRYGPNSLLPHLVLTSFCTGFSKTRVYP